MGNEYKVAGRDIVELFANKMGYTTKLEPFNFSEWYGFGNKDNKNLRAKHVRNIDLKGNFNVRRWNTEANEEFETYCIIQTHNKFTIIKINEFKSNKFVLNNSLEKIIQGTEDTKFSRVEFVFDDTIYQIKTINDTIYGIKQRVDSSMKVDEEAIKKLFENNKNSQCQYCGMTQGKIDKIDEDLKEKNNREYGLTIRERGYKLEVDQINPKEGYDEGNIALCCYWCNNAKTDTFSVTEFKPIARGINQAWNQKLKKAGINETVCFPENSKIWGESSEAKVVNCPEDK